MTPLRAVVVVPARDEEATIGACLRALAGQRGVQRASFAVIVVDDGSVDATRSVAVGVGVQTGLALTVLPGPARGPGAARRVGMDDAERRLPDGALIACTDADTVVAPDWLRRQLDLVAEGADAVAGNIVLDETGLRPGVAERRAALALDRLAAVRAHSPDAEHHHFAGASMALTARAYRLLGGIEPLALFEDVALEHRLRAHGLRIARRSAVRVTTSGRLRGRAQGGGLAHDLAQFDRELHAPVEVG